MKIVVTGALGHIGSELIRMLPEFYPGSEIVMIDNMLTQRYSSLFNLPIGGNYRFIEEDVTTADLSSIVDGADLTVHLAAITDATMSFQNRDIVESTNYGATLKVAEACEKKSVPLILTSSTSVYGSQDELVDENCSLEDLKPQSPYAETKLREEALLRDKFGKKLKYIVFRFGTIFGTSIGMRFHTAVNKFCWQAVMNQPLSVWETAYHQKRPYLYLGDAIKVIKFAADKLDFNGDIYNVVSVNATVKEVVDIIKKYSNEVKIDFVKNKIMNQLSYEVLNNKLSKIGYAANGCLDNGIQETISLFRAINNTK